MISDARRALARKFPRASVKVNSQNALDFAWYVAVVLVAGQLGVALRLMDGQWSNEPLEAVLREQATSGQFMTFASALLASSAYFVVREYNSSTGGIRFKGWKSLLILLSLVLGMLCIWLVVKLSTATEQPMDWQLRLHWLAYTASIVLALAWRWLEESNGSALRETEEWKQGSAELTSLATSTESVGNVKL